MRAQQRYLGLLAAQPPISDEDAVPLECVSFSREARHYLQCQLYAPGRLRGGLMFGSKRGDTLDVRFVSPMGYPWWYADSTSAPLDLDERYVLGWSDCLEVLHGGEIDWVGNWLARPNSLLGDVAEDLIWLGLGAEKGLFDDRHVLVVVGWGEGALTGRAYAHDLGEFVQISCSLGAIAAAR